MKLAKLLAILLVLALVLCLLPAAALAEDPEDPEDTEEAAGTEEDTPEEPAEAGEPTETEEEPADGETPETGDGDEPADAEEPEAEATDEPDGAAEETVSAPVLITADEVGYPMEGEIVYNNGGTVYNNGGTVYNNGGLVYQNGGTVYNNGGVVYANGGTVYNNGGTVYRNDALVYTFDDDVQDSHIYGSVKVSFSADYSAFAEMEGLPEDARLSQDASFTIRPREGWLLAEGETDSGILTENEDGSWTLSEAEEDLCLKLGFRPEAPVFDLAEGSYAEEQTLRISAPAGTEIYYSVDGKEPEEDNRLLYEGPILLDEGVTVIAVALAPGALPSEATEASYAFVTITAPEFESVAEGKDPPGTAGFVLENRGTVNARVASVKLAGENPDAFRLNTERGATVKAGKTDRKTWTVRPIKGLEAGSYSAIAVFTLEGGETVELPLAFTVR